MNQTLEHRIRERAYHLWEKEGSPEGRHQEFWERARLLEEAAARPEVATPLGQRTAKEAAIDEASAQSFPASDPPAFTADTGAGRTAPAAAGSPSRKTKRR